MGHWLARRCVFSMLLAVMMLAPWLARAQSVAGDSLERQPLFPGGQQILGSEGSAVAVIQLPEQAPASPSAVLRLFVALARDVIPQKSTVSIELDGVPLHSSFLSEPTSAIAVTVALPRTLPGYHVLRIRTRLVSLRNPCGSKQVEPLWLRILSESRLEFVRPSSLPSTPSVAALLSSWRSSRAAVTLLTEEQVSQRQLPVVLAADAFLRNLGAQPQTVGDRVRRFIVRVVPAYADDQGMSQGASLRVVGDSLFLDAGTPQELILRLYALRKASTWESCGTEQCDFAPADRNPSAEAAHSSPRDHARAPVRSFRDLGFPSGYVAKGEGQHVLTFAWPRPSFFALKEWPTLRLLVRRSGHPALDPHQSGVDVRLQGQVIARFDLDAADASHRPLSLTVEVPPRFFSADALSFEVVTSLIGSAKPPRCLLEPDALWLVIAPDSGLYVPRTEYSYPNSLAGFAERAAALAPQLVVPKDLSRLVLPRLGAILFPIERGRAWAIATSTSDCGPLCVVISDKSPLTQSDTASSSSTVIATEQNPTARQHQLKIYLTAPKEGEAWTESPDYHSIITTRAELTLSGWQPRGETGKVGKERHVPLPSLSIDGHAIDSHEQAVRKLLDGLWMMILVLAIVLGFLFLRARSRGSAPGVRT